MNGKNLVTTTTIALQKVDLRDILTKNLGGESLGIRDLDTIKVPTGGSKFWTITGPEGTTEVKEINGIIIHTLLTRAYWKKLFEGDKVPPDCYSPDNYTGIGDPGGFCSSCSYNNFGTANEGKGKGKACKERRILFLLLEGNLLPTVLSLPSTSLASIRKYLVFLTIKSLLLKYQVVTKITLTQDKSKDGFVYSVANFEIGKHIDNYKEIGTYIDNILPMLEGAAIEITKQSAGAVASDAEADIEI